MINKDFTQRCNDWLIQALEELLPVYTKMQDWEMVQRISQALKHEQERYSSHLIISHPSSNATADDEEKLNLMGGKNAM